MFLRRDALKVVFDNRHKAQEITKKAGRKRPPKKYFSRIF